MILTRVLKDENLPHNGLSGFSWSDFPLLQEEYVSKDKLSPKRDDVDVILKDAAETIWVSVPSAKEFFLSSMSWSDLPILGVAFEIESEKSATCRDRPTHESTPNKKARTTTNKKVSFNNCVEIRFHKLTIGDHPFCTDSLPISLDWDHAEPMRMDFDDFEAQRKGYCRHLSYFEKKNILRNVSGLQEKDIKERCNIRDSSICLRNLSLALGNCT